MKKAIPLDIRRKVIANMTLAGWRSIPHVCYTYEADVTDLLVVHKGLNASVKHREKIALNTVLLRVLIEGVHAAPRMNAHMHYNRFLVSGSVDVKEEINVNMPILLSSGDMMTVNLRNCGAKTLDQLTADLATLNHKIEKSSVDTALMEVGFSDTLKELRHGKVIKAIGRVLGLVLSPNRLYRVPEHERSAHRALAQRDQLTARDLCQGTITISNLGAAVRGTNGSVTLLDIIPPQVAAIGIGVVQEKASVYEGEDGASLIGIRKILPICIAFDHRALDFGDVAPMIRKMEEVFRKPDVICDW